MINLIQSATGGGAETIALPAIGSLGMTGVAGLIFWFYRKREYEISAEKERRAEDFKTIVQENTAAMVEVTTAVRELTGYIQREKER